MTTTFVQILKFNPYHDPKTGRFTSNSGGTPSGRGKGKPSSGVNNYGAENYNEGKYGKGKPDSEFNNYNAESYGKGKPGSDLNNHSSRPRQNEARAAFLPNAVRGEKKPELIPNAKPGEAKAKPLNDSEETMTLGEFMKRHGSKYKKYHGKTYKRKPTPKYTEQDLSKEMTAGEFSKKYR